MSDEFLVVVAPVVLLCFYPLAIGLAQLKLLQQRPELLKRLHWVGWGLTLLLAAVFMTWGISLRGQWLDVLPFGLVWLAAGSYFWLRRRQLSWPGKFYFGSWFYYPAFLALAYLADKIFFVLVSLPIMAFLPATTYYSDSALTLRAPVSGLLSPARVQLLTPVALVAEKHQGMTEQRLLLSYNDSVLSASLQSHTPLDSVPVLVRTRQGQHLIKFGR